MYNILLSFLKPQIAFGGESGGGGGSSSGGGGSRADKKGAAAVLSPVYTPPAPAITFNDNKRDSAPLYNTQSEALIGQATDIGNGVYDPINILETDAYQLGTGNAIMPPLPANDIVESVSMREGPNPFLAPFNDSIGGGLDAGPFDVFDQDIYEPTPPITYNSELDDSIYNEFVDTARYSGNDSGTYSDTNLAQSNFYDEIPNDFSNFLTPGDDSGTISNTNSTASNFYDEIPNDFSNFGPPGNDSGIFSNTNSINSNFYDEIPNDFSNFATPGNDSGMEMNLNSPDANFYDDNDFQPDPINNILAGEQFTTSAANAPASIPVQTADDGYSPTAPIPTSPDQYDLAASESSRFDGYDTSPSVIRDLALGTDTNTGTAIPTAEEINPTGLSTSELISSAESKNYDNLTSAEQGALYGQYGQQPNAAEMKQMTEVMTRMRDMPMTEEFQDEVVGQLKADGATDSEISSYRKENPIGENVNPFWKRFGELEGFLPKVLRGIENAAMFGIKNLTMGIIDPAKIDKDMATKYMDALQETGTYDYNDPNYLDISDSKKGNANFDKILEMSGRGPEDYEATNILRGVKDAEGNTVAGFNQYQNTPEGAVIFKEEEKEKDRDENICPEGFYFDLIEQMCMPIIGDDAGDDSGLTLGERPSPSPINFPEIGEPVQPALPTPVAGVNFRQPKFFQDGGSVTPNIDSFLSGLR